MKEQRTFAGYLFGGDVILDHRFSPSAKQFPKPTGWCVLDFWTIKEGAQYETCMGRRPTGPDLFQGFEHGWESWAGKRRFNPHATRPHLVGSEAPRRGLGYRTVQEGIPSDHGW